MMIRKRLGPTLYVPIAQLQNLSNPWLTITRLDSWLKKPNGKKHYDRMMTNFDLRLKCRFDGSYQDNLIEVEVPGLPNDASRGVIDGYMDISLADMQGVFEPVIQEILRLIQEQIDKVNEANKRVSVRKISAIYPYSLIYLLTILEVHYHGWRVWLIHLLTQKSRGTCKHPKR